MRPLWSILLTLLNRESPLSNFLAKGKLISQQANVFGVQHSYWWPLTSRAFVLSLIHKKKYCIQML